jgi:allantoinase
MWDISISRNSIPPTTNMENLKAKIKASKGKLHVDVAFWGGVIPGNENDVQSLIKQGVVGFKCFLCPSGVPEFPHVTEDDLEKVAPKIVGTDTVLAFHAEIEHHQRNGVATDQNPKKYQTYLSSRPDSMEEEAIKLVIRFAKKYPIHCHIVHLSSVKNTLALIEEARLAGAKLTVETCHHYLSSKHIHYRP